MVTHHNPKIKVGHSATEGKATLITEETTPISQRNLSAIGVAKETHPILVETARPKIVPAPTVRKEDIGRQPAKACQPMKSRKKMEQMKSKTITIQNHSTPITAFLEKSSKPLKMISGQLTSMSTPTKPPSNWIPDPRSVLLGVRPVDQACKADAHRLTVQRARWSQT